MWNNCNGCNNCNRPPRGGGIFTVLLIFLLSVLIFYQVIITLILPLRFNLSYIDSNGEKKTPILIHRALFGSFE